MKKCRFCAEEVQDAAVVCKHCGRDLATGRAEPLKVTIAGADPFGAYHTEIQGKKSGRITIVGYLGIGLGLLMMVMAVATASTKDDGKSAFGVGLAGLGVSVASFLWVRR